MYCSLIGYYFRWTTIIIKQRNPDVLLIDNIQVFDKCYADIFKVPFVVAIVSPCRKESTGIKSFRAVHRKKDTTITFSPLSLTHTKKFLECHGIKVKEDDTVCSSERENEPVESDNEIYYLEKFERILRSGRGSSSGSEQAKVSGAESSSLGSAQAEMTGAESSEQAKVSGADSDSEASGSVQASSISFLGNLKELDWDDFMKLFIKLVEFHDTCMIM